MGDKEKIAALEAQLATSTQAIKDLKASQEQSLIDSALTKREAELQIMLSEVALPKDSVEVTLSEAAAEGKTEEKVIKATWPALLTGLDDDQFQMIKALLPGAIASTDENAGGDGTGLNFSEFDSLSTSEPVELSEGQKTSLAKRMKEARKNKSAALAKAHLPS